MKFFWALSLSLVFFLSSLTQARAEISDWIYPTTFSGGTYGCGSFSNIANIADGDDGTYSQVSGQNTTHRCTVSGFDLSFLPDNAPISAVEVFWRFSKTTGDFGGKTIANTVNVNDQAYNGATILTSATSYTSRSNWTGTTTYTDTFYWSDNEPTHTDVEDYFDLYGTPDDLYTVIEFSIGSTTQTLRIYDYKIRITYTDPVNINLDSAEASASAQTVRFDLSGDTGVAGDNITCKTQIFESCSRSGYAGWTSDTPVATIWHEDNGNTETVNRGGGDWESYGYSSTNSTWQADGVTVPYNPEYDCSYPTHLVCTERVIECGELGCSWTDTIIHADRSSGTITPTAGITSTGFTEPEPTNPLAWVIWKLKQTFWELFRPDFGLINQEYQALKSSIQTKAPFAYVYPIFTLDFSPVASEETLTLSIPTAVDDTYIPDTIEWTMPSSLDAFFDLFKAGISVLLGLLFILYLFSVSRRLF